LVYFLAKGHVVTPRRVRKEFGIEEGTQAYVEAIPECILIRPVIAVLIKRGRGIAKRNA